MDLNTVRAALAGPLDPFLESGACRPAAVLLVIHGERPRIVMTEKPENMRVHAGEISFPGGKPEGGDADLCETALRETCEEIGFRASRRDVVGQLDAVRTLNSRYLILPFVAVVERAPRMSPNAEVKSILDIPLEPFLGTLAPDRSRGPHPGMFTLRYRDKTVWGASARILHQVCRELGRGL